MPSIDDLRDVLSRQADRIEPPSDRGMAGLAGVRARAERRRRRTQATRGALAAVVVATGGLATVLAQQGPSDVDVVAAPAWGATHLANGTIDLAETAERRLPDGTVVRLGLDLPRRYGPYVGGDRWVAPASCASELVVTTSRPLGTDSLDSSVVAAAGLDRAAGAELVAAVALPVVVTDLPATPASRLVVGIVHPATEARYRLLDAGADGAVLDEIGVSGSDGNDRLVALTAIRPRGEQAVVVQRIGDDGRIEADREVRVGPTAASQDGACRPSVDRSRWATATPPADVAAATAAIDAELAWAGALPAGTIGVDGETPATVDDTPATTVPTPVRTELRWVSPDAAWVAYEVDGGERGWIDVHRTGDRWELSAAARCDLMATMRGQVCRS